MQIPGDVMTWSLMMYSAHRPAAHHGAGVVQVVKSANLPACETARGGGSAADGVVTVRKSDNKDVQGFIAAMNGQESKVEKLGDGTDVAPLRSAERKFDQRRGMDLGRVIGGQWQRAGRQQHPQFRAPQNDAVGSP